MGDHQLRSKSYYILLVALAVSDLLVGLVVEPLYCWFFICLLNECGMCIFTLYVFLIGACNSWSLCALMMASVERYLAVQLPFWHRAQVTAKRVKRIAATLFLTLPITMVTTTIFFNELGTLKKLPPLRYMLGNIAVTLYCTIRVAFTAHSKKWAIKPTTATQQPQEDQDEEGKRTLKEFKEAFTLGILVFSSVILYFPSIIVNIINVVKGKDVTPEFKYIAQHIVLTIINLQSLINPFIMSLRITKIRNSLKTKIMSCFRIFNGHGH